eukprot:s1204_g13.t1
MCKKAPKGATLRQMYKAQLRRDGAAGNKIRNSSRIKTARNKAIDAAKNRNHTPFIINVKKKCQTKNGSVMICGRCFTTSFNCKWKQDCPGQFKGVGRVPPSTPFWKFYGKRFGLGKLCNMIGLDKSMHQRIQGDIQRLEKERSTPSAIKRFQRKEAEEHKLD